MCNVNGHVIGVGVDLCGIARIERAIGKESFMRRVYSPQECAYLDGKGKGRAQSAAAMFAAKEAAAKALGTGFAKGVCFVQIEVTHDENGAPGLQLSGAALERMKEIGGKRILLSLSHEGDMAIAFAVIEG